MSSKKMNQRSQIKRGKTKRSEDKMDKAMSDIKKIGIISCCLVAVLLVVGIFVNQNESYAAGFLQQLPDNFYSGMTTENQSLISGISLPKEFYGTNGNERLSYIYCMDHRLGMMGATQEHPEWSHLYEKSSSVKSSFDLGETNRSATYNGLIYILQNDNITGDGSKDYYLTQLAVWWYLDKANGFEDGYNYTSYDLSSATTSEDGKYKDGNYAFYNNLSAADKDAIIADQTYGKIVQDLVAGAVANQNNYTQVSGSQDINVDTSNITYTMTGDYIETSVIKPTSSNQSFKSYTVQINNSVGNIEIVDENNNPIAGTYINANQGFKLRVPASEVQNENFKANITIVGYFEDLYDAFVYMPNPSYHEKLSGIRSEGTCENESPTNICFENKEACTSTGNVFDEATGKCSVRTELQRALLGKIESPSTPTTIDLEVPTIDVPDTNSTSYIVYGIGALIIIAGIVLIVMAKGPKNAKKK